MTAVFVTGAAGFLGGAVAARLAVDGCTVFGGVRRPGAVPAGVTPVVTGDLAAGRLVLPAVDAVVHAAGLGHRRGVTPDIWERENVAAAAAVAQAARAAGAGRFIMISTAHVYGRVAAGVVSDESPLNPMDAYAASKLRGEAAAQAMFGPKFCAVRPVAVIGAGAPGNLNGLMRALQAGLPLPLAGLRNARSFVAAADLAGLVALLVERGEGAVLAANPEAVSTPDLVRVLAEALGVQARLFAVPEGVLAAAAKLAGRGAMVESLAGSFQAAPQRALAAGWRPGVLADGLRETARGFAARAGG